MNRGQPGFLKTGGYPGIRGVITRRVQIAAGIEVEPYTWIG